MAPSMTYSNTEKTAIVLTLLGEATAEDILGKLPRDIVERIQNEVIPIMEFVDMPSDIDSFILDEIIRDPAPVPDSDTEPDAVIGIENDWDPVGCDDETLLNCVSASVALKVLLGENRVFHRLLFDFFPDPQQELMTEQLSMRQIQIPQIGRAHV